MPVHSVLIFGCCLFLRPVIRRPVEAYLNIDYIVDKSIRKLQQVTVGRDKVGAPTLSVYRSEGQMEYNRESVLARLLEHQESLSATAESMNGLLELRINPTDTQVVYGTYYYNFL